MMPGVDGFELCRRSKADLLTCHIPFLLLTAKGDEENRAEGYSAGADGYIAKPFSIKTLRTRVNSLIEQRIKLRERYRQKLLTDPSEIPIESETTNSSTRWSRPSSRISTTRNSAYRNCARFHVTPTSRFTARSRR